MSAKNAVDYNNQPFNPLLLNEKYNSGSVKFNTFARP